MSTSTSMSSFIHWPKSSCQYFVNATQRRLCWIQQWLEHIRRQFRWLPVDAGTLLFSARCVVALHFSFTFATSPSTSSFSFRFCFALFIYYYFFLRLRFLSSFWVWRSLVHGQGQTPATLKQWKRWKASVEITQQLTNPFNTVHLNAASLTERSSARQFNLDSNESIDSFD